MIRLASWLLGFSIGASFGALMVMLLVPATATEVRHRLRAGYQETMEASRLASQQRRHELEAELASKQGRALPLPVPRGN